MFQRGLHKIGIRQRAVVQGEPPPVVGRSSVAVKKGRIGNNEVVGGGGGEILDPGQEHAYAVRPGACRDVLLRFLESRGVDFHAVHRAGVPLSQHQAEQTGSRADVQYPPGVGMRGQSAEDAGVGANLHRRRRLPDSELFKLKITVPAYGFLFKSKTNGQCKFVGPKTLVANQVDCGFPVKSQVQGRFVERVFHAKNQVESEHRMGVGIVSPMRRRVPKTNMGAPAKVPGQVGLLESHAHAFVQPRDHGAVPTGGKQSLKGGSGPDKMFDRNSRGRAKAQTQSRPVILRV